MERKKSFLSRYQSLTAAVSVLASVVAVAGFVYATTIGSAISVDTTLTVTGASTLTGNVSAAGTLAVTGASTFSTTTVQGSFNTGAITATGTAASVFNNLTVVGVCTGCSNAFAYPWTPTSNYGLIMTATSTNIFASGSAGFYASSSSMFASTTVQGSFNVGAITATGTAASVFNNLTVGGTLGVTGVSTFTGGVASLSVTGASTLSTTTVQGSFNTGAVTATGTVASSFNNTITNASSTYIGTTNVSGILVAGNSAGFGTSTPAEAVGIAGDVFISNSGTTTLLIKTAGAGTAGAGSCLEMLAGSGATYRVYINAASNAFVVEAGACK